MDEAERLLLQAWSLDGSSADTAALLGDLYTLRHKLEAGVGRPGAPSSADPAEWYQRALVLDPDNVAAHRGLASYHLQHWDPERALALYSRLRTLSHGDVRVEIEIGRCHLLLQDYAEAERVLRGALAGDGTSLEPQDRQTIEDLLARTLMALGRDTEAEGILSAAARANTRRPDSGYTACPFVALGYLYRSRGEEAPAARELMTAADLQQPPSPIYDHEAAVACLVVGDLDDAERLVRRALAAEDQPQHRQLLDWILKDRAEGARGESAVVDFERAVQAFQDYRFDESRSFIEAALARDSHPWFLVVAGLLASTRMDYTAAEAYADGARARDPAEPGVDVVLGHVLLARTEYRAAHTMLASVERELRPEIERYVPTQQASGYRWTIYKMARIGLAWSDSNQGRHEDALAHYDVVLRYQSADRFGLLGKSNSLMGLGRLDEARRVAEQLTALDPTNRYALTNQALLAYNLGDDALAERRYQEALRDDATRYSCPHVGLGLMYLRQGRTGEARDQFQRAIAAEPNTEPTKYNELARLYIEEGRLDDAEDLLRISLEILPEPSNEAHRLIERVRSLRQGAGVVAPAR